MHGWGVDSSCFDDLMDSLKEKYQVFAIDLPGFGKSVEPSDYYVLEDYVGLVEQFVNDKKLANPIILGIPLEEELPFDMLQDIEYLS